MKKLCLYGLSLLLLPALASTPQFTDSAQEAQYYDLIRVIRCHTCQNQNISESDAPLARQLREQIESQIKDGRDNREITDYLVDRYGDFITYAPPFAARTWLLWLSPFAIMLIAVVTWFVRRPRKILDSALSSDEKAELDTLITRYRKTS